MCAVTIIPSTLTLAATAASVIWEAEIPSSAGSSAAIWPAVAVASKSVTLPASMRVKDTPMR